MTTNSNIKIRSVLQLYEAIPMHERIMVDVLRQVITAKLPAYCREKISYNVPFFFGHKGICIIWPAAIPRGGIKKGVLLGFWHGNKLVDEDKYLTRGSNKQVFYKIFNDVEEIDVPAIEKLLEEAVKTDCRIKTKKDKPV
ncbi:MAG: DUF1801 domain-containing protein [Chitinophagaceae bacterium]|nr:DUF1801 domain-containing protein [Chitinophagaceae bacterium]